MPAAEGILHLAISKSFSLPSINNYITLSLLLFCSGGLYYYRIFNNIVTEEEWSNSSSQGPLYRLIIPERIFIILSTHRLLNFVLLNTCTAVVALFGKSIVFILFKQLLAQEHVQLKNVFRRYLQSRIFFLIFISHQSLFDDIFKWMPWSALNVTCILLNELIAIRMLNLRTSSAMNPNISKFRLLTAIGINSLISLMMLTMALFTLQYLNVNYSLFLIADATLTILQSFQLVIKLVNKDHSIAHNKGQMFSILDFFCEMIHDIIEFGNYLHMIFFSELAITYCCIFLIIKAQHFYSTISNKIKKRMQHRAIVQHISQRYTNASDEDLLKNDLCTICWDSMKFARKLPCGHVFHEACLYRWLEQDSSCAICRKVLDLDLTQVRNNDAIQRQRRNTLNEEMNNTLQYFIETFSPHNNRLARWWSRLLFDLDDDQLELMTNQVSDMFPQFGRESIRNLIRTTGSSPVAIEAILRGALQNDQQILDITDSSQSDTSESNITTDDSLSDDNDEQPLRDAEQTNAANLNPAPVSSFTLISDGKKHSPSEIRIPARLEKTWLGSKMFELIEFNRNVYMNSKRAEDLRKCDSTSY